MSTNVANDVRAAVVASDSLPAPLRHFLLTLAQLADWRTGSGYAGQGRLARAMGCDVRSVKRYKSQLATCVTSPVTVTWSHRNRADGFNGSDRYQLSVSPSAAQVTDLQAEVTDCQAQGTICHTNITIGSPQVTPQDKKENENKMALGLPGQANNLGASDLRINGFHVAGAKRCGADVEELRAEWQKAHQQRQTLFASQQHLQASFGGWLKRKALEAEKEALAPAEDEWEEV